MTILSITEKRQLSVQQKNYSEKSEDNAHSKSSMQNKCFQKPLQSCHNPNKYGVKNMIIYIPVVGDNSLEWCIPKV